MDKEKTGNLIKEARIKTGYTQSELGALIGVTNKAISRWENGESFPDVGVLEELSRVLNLDIKDIITGESGSEISDAVTEITRVVKIQERERQNKKIKNVIIAMVILLLLFIGTVAFGRRNFCPVKPWIYYLCVAIVTGLAVFFTKSDRDFSVGFDKCIKWMTIICFLTSIYIVAMTILSVYISAKNGIPTNIGIIVNIQLCISFWINAICLVSVIFAAMRWGSKSDFGILVTLFNGFISVNYSLRLHNMVSFEGMVRDIVIDTFCTVIIIALCYCVAGFAKNFSKKMKRR